MQALAVAAGVVAVVGLTGLTISQGMRASNESAKAEDLQAAAAIAVRPDADLCPSDRSTRCLLRGWPSST